MKQPNRTHRAAIALLLAGVALPLNPVVGQAPAASPPPLVNAPPPTATAPAPAPVNLAPPPVVQAPAARVQTAPAAAAPAATERRTEPARTRAETRTATRRTSAPARAAPAAPAAEASAPAPLAETALPPAAPAALPPPVDLPPAANTPAATTELPAEGTGAWPWLLVALGVAGLGLFAWMLMRRRRRSDDMIYEEEYYPVEEPAASTRPDLAYFTPAAAAAALATPAMAQEPEPYVAPTAAVAPAAAAVPIAEASADDAVASPDTVAVTEPNAADVEALAAESRAPLGRPWLEFLMRPIRAGTTGDETRVEFELTVGKTGSVPAEDVRISTWMFAAGSAGESEMERMLIEPPADAKLSEMTIAAGDGARVEAALALPKTPQGDAVLPVVVADARYRLPDGSEGRTSASFEVGLPGGETLEPFPVDRTSGLLETVEARLHGDLERA